MSRIRGTVPLNGAMRGETPASSDYARFRDSATAIVIDQGSYACRIGWGSENTPRFVLHPFVSRSKGRRDNENSVVIGSPTGYVDTSRTTFRSPYDGEIMTNIDVQESILDSAFEKLGIDTSGINHPVVMSESICNPNYCRTSLSELMFECYQVPSVCFGVDALFSFHYNNNAKDSTGLIFRSGNMASHILPVVSGVLDAGNSKRINIGGYHVYDYCTKSLHLRYPHLKGELNPSRCQEIKEKHLLVSSDYCTELQEFQSDPEKLEASEVLLQLPFVKIEAPVISEEEKERKAQIRRDNIQKMRDLAAKKRLEKVAAKEKQLADLHELKAQKHEDPEYFKEQLQELGYKSEVKLDKAISDLTAAIDKAQGKEEIVVEQKEPSFPLLDVPDNQLSSSELAEKKKQKLLKILYDGRVRAKKRKDELRAAMEQKEQAEEKMRQENLKAWLIKVHKERDDLIQRKSRREQERSQINSRKSEMSKKRMKLIANAATQEDNIVEDTFGANDDDWLVYRQMSKEVESNSEDDEKIEKLTSMLIKYDPDFENGETQTDAFDQEKFYQVTLGSERIRFPEIIFQPSMVGTDSAGVFECMQLVFSRYGRKTQLELAKNVFLTGGNTIYPGILERFRNGIREMRPFQSEFKVRQADDPFLDAWRGAASLSRGEIVQCPDFRRCLITRQIYEEYGSHYLVEHNLSNQFYPPYNPN